MRQQRRVRREEFWLHSGACDRSTRRGCRYYSTYTPPSTPIALADAWCGWSQNSAARQWRCCSITCQLLHAFLCAPVIFLFIFLKFIRFDGLQRLWFDSTSMNMHVRLKQRFCGLDALLVVSLLSDVTNSAITEASSNKHKYYTFSGIAFSWKISQCCTRGSF